MSAPHIPTLRELERREAALKRQAENARKDSKGKIPSLPPPPTARERALLALPAPMPVSLDTANTINMETEMRTVLQDALRKGMREQAIAAEARGHLITPRPAPRIPRGSARPGLTESVRVPEPVPPEWPAWVWACVGLGAVIFGYALIILLAVHNS